MKKSFILSVPIIAAMQQSFVSAYGKVILENDILFIRNTKPVLTFTRFAEVAMYVLVIIRFIASFFEENIAKRNTGLVMWGLVSLVSVFVLGSMIYKALWQQSFSKRIPLNKIVTYRAEEDGNDLEVHLFLKLRSGKERKITFRKLEKQHEALSEMLSQYLSSPKFA